MLKNIVLVSNLAMLVFVTTGHAETVYKLKDESGATVYSDRPNLQGTTNAGTVDLPPGPSAEEQQAAVQRVRHMQSKSEEMRQIREDKEQERNAEQDKTTPVVQIEASGSSTVDDRRLDPKTRIPVETPGGGEHPIYEPGKGPPVHVAPRPRPRSGN